MAQFRGTNNRSTQTKEAKSLAMYKTEFGPTHMTRSSLVPGKLDWIDWQTKMVQRLEQKYSSGTDYKAYIKNREYRYNPITCRQQPIDTSFSPSSTSHRIHGTQPPCGPVCTRPSPPPNPFSVAPSIAGAGTSPFKAHGSQPPPPPPPQPPFPPGLSPFPPMHMRGPAPPFASLPCPPPQFAPVHLPAPPTLPSPMSMGLPPSMGLPQPLPPRQLNRRPPFETRTVSRLSYVPMPLKREPALRPPEMLRIPESLATTAQSVYTRSYMPVVDLSSCRRVPVRHTDNLPLTPLPETPVPRQRGSKQYYDNPRG